MSHEISEVVIDGKNIVEAMYANEPAWHNLGEVLQGEVYSPEAIEKSHTGWLVGKQRMRLMDDNTEVEDYFALVRQDTKKTLHVVGNEYKVLQNSEAFSFLDSLVKGGLMRYEAAFALKGGKHVCLVARMPSIDEVAPGDKMLRYVFFNNTHGGGAIQCTPTSVRVVCANTKRMAISEGKRNKTMFSIHHSGDMQAKLSVLSKYLSQFDKGFEQFKEGAKSLLKGLTDKQRVDYLEQLFPTPDSKATDRVKNNRQTLVAQVERALRSDAQQLQSIKGTWWAMFNAVTEATDHADKLRTASDARKASENRFLEVMTGTGADFKDRAFELALSLAG